MMKKVLTIGAYERDNFGDALFFVVLNYIARSRGVQLVPGSIMGADMREYFGEYVFPYDFLLKHYQFDAVWVVGGEMGGCDMHDAFSMSLPYDSIGRYNDASSEIKNISKTFLSGISDNQIAYLPILKKYTKNIQTPLVVNSVGGFESLEQSPDNILLDDTLDVLKSAKFVSVRNQETNNYLQSKEIQSILVPDSVHAISLLYQPTKTYDEPYIVFQLSEHLCNVYGLEIVAKSIVDIINTYNMPVYLFAAGTANNHDSLLKYKDIKTYIEDALCETRVHIVYEVHSLKRVDIIAHAHLWIGSSLHGRIVAMSYGVARVSFFVPKVINYATLWDPEFPYNATPQTLVNDCHKALSVDHTSVSEIGEKLADQAIQNIYNIFDTLYDR